MSAPDTIHALVAKFDQHQKEYQTHKNETELRREFLDPFFEALGWDVFNKKSYSERFKEVVHEASVEVEGKAKAADYAFRVGDKTMFFVEAKKPSVNIGENPEPAFQLRRYGWSAKLPISILTDFEQLAVYECNTKPHNKDKASVGRVKLYHYSGYIQKWDEIAGIFSHEAVLQGAFDQFAEETKGKKVTAQVDDAFLEEIERWRDLLAHNIALRNPSIQNERELNFAVQLTIDRVIFLRICEDRGIEPERQLQDIGNKEQIYTELVTLFRRADTQYNSGLFHFSDEKGQSSSPDTLTPDLQIDDRVLKDILRNLYYPESPYVFTYLSADILGQVYERFLGKVIRLTEGHHAKVEEKPEVRKAGGVYYTPTYIVDYIVKNTVGKLVEGKTPKQVAELKILDPACGSGSFLLGAYQYLLNWHDDWYTQNEPEKWAKGKDPAVYQAMDGDWRLTTNEKKRILLNNIYGVDIDAQAVEVTKLSLLLKVLEEESGQLTLGFERVLPDLGENIKCGNSLIGPDYYEERQMPLLPDEEFYRVNAFDWKKEFGQVFAQGGFDTVIGNPPYVRQESLSEYKEYFQKKYKTYDGVADLYIYFIEQGIKVLRNGGLYSIIVSNSFLRATYGKPLRKFLAKNSDIVRIVDFGGLPIFDNAKDTYVCIPLLSNSKPKQEVEICKVPSVKNIDLPSYVEENKYSIPLSQLSQESWSLDRMASQELFAKITEVGIKLGNYVNKNFYRGVTTGLNKAFVVDTETKEKLIKQDPKSTELIKSLLQGEDIRQWHITPKGKWLIFTRRGTDIDAYPAIKQHLSRWKEDLAPKQDRKQKRGRKPGRYQWFEIQDDVAYYKVFDGPKIIFPDIAKFPRFYFDVEGYYLANTGYAIGTDDFYLLGILNSKLFWFAISKISIPFGIRAGEYRYRLIYQYMEKVPIRPIDFSNPAEKAQHDKMVALVESMLELHKRDASAKTPQEKEMLARHIETTDKAIDSLVYELYGLTEEEIKIVEGE